MLIKIKYLNFLIVLISLLFNSHLSIGQILNDSTVQVYGPATVELLSKEDLLFNRSQGVVVDTSIENVHLYQPFFNDGIYFQDLGNVGTPLYVVNKITPKNIGVEPGIIANNYYKYFYNNPIYIDTKSPYTKLNYKQGLFLGQQRIDLLHTRNINEQANVGIQMSRQYALKQIGAGNRTEKDNEHWDFNIFGYYKSKNQKYIIFSQYNFWEHVNYENGGIYADSLVAQDDMFDYKLEEVNLFSQQNSNKNQYLRTKERGLNWNLTQRYNLIDASKLFVFYDGNYQFNQYRYDDSFLAFNTGIYSSINYDSNATNQRHLYELIENKAGIGGKANRLNYLIYAQHRGVNWSQNYYPSGFHYFKSEFYIGTSVALKLNDSIDHSIILNLQYNPIGDYLAELNIKFTKWYLKSRYLEKSPVLVAELFTGNHDIFNSKYNSSQYLDIDAGIQLKTKSILLSPSIQLQNTQNYLYLASDSSFRQSTDLISILSPKLNFRLKFFKRLYIEEMAVYNLNSSSEVKMPDYITKSSIYYRNDLIDGNLKLKFGYDFYYVAGWQPYAWNPLLMNYQLNDNFNAPSYVRGDVYLNAGIKKGTIYLKASYIDMNFTALGYFSSAYYSAMPRRVEVGVRWMFFD